MNELDDFRPAASLVATVEQEWGDAGRRWLQELPGILRRCAAHWRLVILQSNFLLTYNHVTEVVREDGSIAVLKVGLPRAELWTELHSLQAFWPGPVVRVLDSHQELGALLLERLRPGTVLEELQPENDRTATESAASVIARLPVPVPPGSQFPSVLEWSEALQEVLDLTGDSGPLPGSVLRKARALCGELAAGCAARLLHGDLHHGNILHDCARGWVAIDPKGVIGDPAYEAARFLNNPRPGLLDLQDPVRAIRERLEILSGALGIDRARLAGWAYVDCAIGSCWSIQCGETDCDFSRRCIEIFNELL
jgi:streptomycin 6-kinase